MDIFYPWPGAACGRPSEPGSGRGGLTASLSVPAYCECPDVTAGRWPSGPGTGPRTGCSGLSRAVWDTAAAMRVVRRFAVAGLDQAAGTGGRRGLAVGAIDETSQVKQGQRTAGVKRHYLGCAGKVANGITTVHLAYAREGTGHALIAARQWIPREHLEDPARRRVMRLPPGLSFGTKGQLATDLLGEVLADGIRLDFACGDEVYGSCTQLREYLEARGQAYVLRVPSNFYLTVARGVKLTCRQAAALPGAAGRFARPATAPRASAGTPGPGWAPPPRVTTCSSASRCWRPGPDRQGRAHPTAPGCRRACARRGRRREFRRGSATRPRRRRFCPAACPGPR
jgi:hypothetical protein